MSFAFNPSKAAVALTLSNVVVMAINALVGVLIARLLTAVQYGQVAYFMSIFLLATLLGGFGLTSQAMRDMAEHYTQHNFRSLNQCFYTLLSIRFGTGLLLIAILALYAYYEQSSIPLIVGCSAALSMLADFLTGALRGVQRIRALIIVLWCQPVSYLLFLLVGEISSADQVVIAFGMSFGIAAMVAAVLLLGSAIGLPQRGSFSRAYAWASSEFAMQLYSISLLQVAYASAGAFFLGLARFYQATGLISVALTITRMVPLVLGPTLGSIFYPQLSTDLVNIDRTAARRGFESFYRTYLLISIGGAALLYTYPDTAIHMLYTVKYIDAMPVLQILAPVSLMMVLDLIFTWTLVAHRATRQTLLFLAVRLGLLVVGGVIATQGLPQMAAMALAVTYLVSASISLIMQAIAIRQVTKYSLHIREVLTFGLLALCIALLCRYLLPELSFGSILFMFNALVAGLIYGAIVLMILFRSWIQLVIRRLSLVALLRIRQ